MKAFAIIVFLALVAIIGYSLWTALPIWLFILIVVLALVFVILAANILAEWLYRR